MRRLRILTLLSVFLSIVVFAIKNKKPSTIPAGKGLLVDKTWLHANPNSLTPVNDRRPPDQTFLTYPEWFLVFSPAEQADYFTHTTSTSFPYLKHLDQLWKGYGVVYYQIRGNYPFNGGYHVMIVVIAGSTTVEYTIKSWYETVVGRMTNPKGGSVVTDEDRLNAAYMQHYVNFIVQKPWYEFDFNHELKQLWTATPFFGPHFLRKIERRYYLTTELAVKSAYGWLIGLGTKATYNVALDNTTVITDKLPDNTSNIGEIRNSKQLPDGSFLIDLPRYAAFNPIACKLANENITFKEIAGNNAAIMLTVLTNQVLLPVDSAKVLFTQPIETKPGLNRVALVTTVANLSKVVKALLKRNVQIEHIYDY